MSVGAVQPFPHIYTLSIAATTVATSQRLAAGGTSVLVTNAAGDYAFVRLGSTGVLATINDVPVPAGARLLLHAPEPVNAVSVVLNSGTGTVFVSRGAGTAY